MVFLTFEIHKYFVLAVKKTFHINNFYKKKDYFHQNLSLFN